MKSTACSATLALSLAAAWLACPPPTWGQHCRCNARPAGPGGGVDCASDQTAYCNDQSGECNCRCDSLPPGKSKDEYEAAILSRVLREKVRPEDVHSRKYEEFVPSFEDAHRKKGTYSFEWQAEGKGKPGDFTGNTGTVHVTVGVPEWLEKIIVGSGTSPGPGALLQNCPNGNCGSGGAVSQSNSGGINVQQATTGNLSPITNSPITINSPPTVFYNYDGSNKKFVGGGDVKLVVGDANKALLEIQQELAAGRDVESLSHAKELMTAEPTWATPHIAAGLACLNLGKLADAKRELAQARSLVPPGYPYEADYAPHLKKLEEAIRQREPQESQ